MLRRRQRLFTWLILLIVVYIIYKYYHRRRLDWDDIVYRDDSWLGGRVKGAGDKFDNWIVVTTVQRPTQSLKQLAELPGWKMVVVGDRKTPHSWNIPGVVYLDVEKQQALQYSVYSLLPFDSYTRKVIGYLYAIEHGAQYIFETDDDNYIEHLDNFIMTKPYTSMLVSTDKLTFNPYQHFGQSSVWPRGFPLSLIGQSLEHKYKVCSPHIAAIQQGVVDGDPDVDALFRMTRKNEKTNLDIRFDLAAPVLNLPIGTFAPLNTQNTFHTYVAFWSLILPTTIPDRATDIYRSYWAQKLLSLTCNHVSFHPSTGFQKRNKWHSNIKDARDEVQLYTQMDNLLEFLRVWTCTKTFLFDCMYQLTKDMVYMGYLEKRDMDLVSAFTTDLSSLGYSPPALVSSKACRKFTDCADMRYYPWEQKTTWAYSPNKTVAPLLNFEDNWGNFVVETCGSGHFVYLRNAFKQSPLFPDVLLVVTLYSGFHLIPYMEILYKSYFPHILYCGSTNIDKVEAKNWKVTYITPGTKTDPVSCLSHAVKMNYNVAGYLEITIHHFLNVNDMHVSNHNKNQVWITGEDLYVVDNDLQKTCEERKIHCTTLEVAQFEKFKAALLEVHLPGRDTKQEDSIKACLMKTGADPTLKQKAVINQEIVMYLPSDKTSLFVDLVEHYLKSSVFDGYRFLAFVIVQCMDNAPEFLHSARLEAAENSHYDYIFPIWFSREKTHRKLICDAIKK